MKLNIEYLTKPTLNIPLSVCYYLELRSIIHRIVIKYTKCDIQCHCLFGVTKCYIFLLLLYMLPSKDVDVL